MGLAPRPIPRLPWPDASGHGGDLFALAHYLICVPKESWSRHCDEIFAETDYADKFRKRFCLAHRTWGNGSVMGRLGSLTMPVRSSAAFQDPRFCEALGFALEALARWRSFKAELSSSRQRPALLNPC